MNDPIALGVVGTGFGLNVHVPAFRVHPGCRVVGTCASTLARASAAAARAGVPLAFGDWREMVADPRIDALALAVPPILQASIVKAAADARKPVFCEKPVAPTASEARAMLRAVEQAGVAHAVNFSFPEIKAWKAAKEIVQGGTLGTLRQVVLTWRVETYAHCAGIDSWKLRRDEGGGTLNNFVSHSLYCLEWLFGPIRKIAARLLPEGAKDDARVEAWVEFAAGLSGNLAVAADAFLGSGHRLEVYGGEGTLVLENTSSDYIAGFTLKVGTRKTGRWTAVDLPGEPSQVVDGRIGVTSAIAHRFLDAVSSGAPVTPNLSDGARVQDLIDAIRSASETGAWRAVAPADLS